MMTQEIGNHPEPDAIWDYLKSIDSKMLEIEGDTFDGLYMYYKGRYLYSWDTPYSRTRKPGMLQLSVHGTKLLWREKERLYSHPLI